MRLTPLIALGKLAAPTCDSFPLIMVQPAPPARQGRFQRFAEFYPFYLSEHRDRTCRRLHFVGTALVVLVLIATLVSRNGWLLAAAPIAGYGFAWVGHFVFERNRPATFKHPWYSLLGDFVLFRDILIGRIKF